MASYRLRGCLAIVVVVSTMSCLAGCQKSAAARQWEIAVENKSDVPCSIVVEMAAGSSQSNARLDGVTKGNRVTLVVGDAATTVRSVKVTRNNEEQVVEPNLQLPVGKRCLVVMDADGKLSVDVSDR